MTEIGPTPEDSWPKVVDEERRRLQLGDLSAKALSNLLAKRALNGGTDRMTHHAAYELEAAERLARFDRLTRLLGLLAPAGTAPRTAIEQIYIQSETDDMASQVILDLRAMLHGHWGEWTPALREAEGFPPAIES
jgi:hypothetical protein